MRCLALSALFVCVVIAGQLQNAGKRKNSSSNLTPLQRAPPTPPTSSALCALPLRSWLQERDRDNARTGRGGYDQEERLVRWLQEVLWQQQRNDNSHSHSQH